MNKNYIKTPFDELSYSCLLFLEEKTRNQEPWMGMGIATKINEEILAALKRKPEYFDPGIPKPLGL